MTKLIAVFDANKRLVGTKKKARPGKDDVVLPDNCDLPTDGSYKWADGIFVPLGHGFGPVVAKPPISEAAVLGLFCRIPFQVTPAWLPAERCLGF